MAELALEGKLYNQVCFHSQQCVEKVLKGLLAKFGRTIPRTHSITDLMENLAAGWFDDLHDDLTLLDDCYLTARYSDAMPGSFPAGQPEEEDAEQSIALARTVTERAWRLMQSDAQ